MTISLHTIKPKVGSAVKRKRIGRGNAAGQGTYSGKGLKGQKCRSGVSNLKRLGMKQVLLRTPKARGFKSHRPKNQVINLHTISAEFKDGSVISPLTLLDKGLIEDAKGGVKILAQGKLTLKKLKFKKLKLSDSAVEEIKKAEGEIL